MASTRDRTAQNGLIAFLLVIGVIVLAWLVVWPTWQNIQTDKATLADVQSQHDAKQKTLGDVTTLLGNYKTRQDALAFASQALPDEPAVPQLLADIDSISRQAGMQVQQVRITDPSKTAVPAPAPAGASGAASAQPAPAALATPTEVISKPPQLVKLRVEVSVIGTYANFPLFMDLLQKNLRLLDIQQLVTDSGGGQNESLPKFNLVLTAYYQH